MTTKLQIIGPYTPYHEGPYAWVKGNPVRCVVHEVVGDRAFITAEGQPTPFLTGVLYIRNAEEIPMAREFWVNEYPDGGLTLFDRFEDARDDVEGCEITRTIHVREVLPGDGA